MIFLLSRSVRKDSIILKERLQQSPFSSRSVCNEFLLLKERPQSIPDSHGASSICSLFSRSVRNKLLFLNEPP